MKVVNVKGISSIGTQREINYVYPYDAKNDFEAIEMCLGYANEEYSMEWDSLGKPIQNSEFKEFVSITSIEVIEE